MTKRLNGKAFYDLIKARFAHEWYRINYMPYLTATALDSNRCVGIATVFLITYYTRLLHQDAEETGLYTGPVAHREMTLLHQVQAYAIPMCLKGNIRYRQRCYDLLNSVGERATDKEA